MTKLVHLRHNRIELALHTLRSGEGWPLLMLHGLGERTPERVPVPLSGWPGPIHGLDFTGHGQSTVPAGGGYTAEILMADADTALGHLGTATLYGRGLGAYVALMLAGARPTTVIGAVLDDGPGLAGGGSAPATPLLHRISPDVPSPPDPYALAEMSTDVRPADYAAAFVRQAVHLGVLEPCIAVSARVRPDWLMAVVGEFGTIEEPVVDALARFATT